MPQFYTDPSITNQIRQPENPLDVYARLQQLRGMQTQQQEADIRMRQLQEAERKQAAVRAASRQAVVPGQSMQVSSGDMNLGGVTISGAQTQVSTPTRFDNQKFLSALASGDAPELGIDFQQQFATQEAAQQKAALEQKKLRAEIVEISMRGGKEQLAQLKAGYDLAGQWLGAVLQAPPEMRPRIAQQVAQNAVQQGLVAPERVPPGLLQGQYTAETEQWVKQMAQQTRTAQQIVDEQLERDKLANKAPETVNTAEGVYVLKPNGTLGNRLGSPTKALQVNNGTGASSSDAKDIAQAIISGEQPPDLKGLYRYSSAVRAELARNGFNLSQAQSDWAATQKHLATLNGPQQERLRQAVDFTYHSLDNIDELYQEWKRVGASSGIKLFNRAALAAAKNLPGEAGAAASTLQAQINDLISELGTVYKGGNSSTDESLKLAAENLKAEWNEETFNKAMGQIRKNLQIRRNSMLTSQPAGVSNPGRYAGGGQAEAAPAQPKVGDTKKFPNGRTGVWDGNGWAAQ